MGTGMPLRSRIFKHVACIALWGFATYVFASCPEQLSYFPRYHQVEMQDSSCVFSWEIESFLERWPTPLDLGRETPWQDDEKTIEWCLYPQRIFAPIVDDLLRIAKEARLGIKVFPQDDVLLLVVGDCRLKMVVCIDENHKLFNVDVNYGCIDGRVVKVKPTCEGDGCDYGEKQYELSRSDVISGIRRLAAEVSFCPMFCHDIPRLRPYVPSCYLKECPFNGDDAAFHDFEDEFVRLIVLFRQWKINAYNEQEWSQSERGMLGRHPAAADGWCGSNGEKGDGD